MTVPAPLPKDWNPSQGWLTSSFDTSKHMASILGSFDTSKHMASILGSFDTERNSTRVLEEFRDEFLGTTDPDEIREAIDQVGHSKTEAELEQLAGPVPDPDPFLEPFLRRAAQFTQEQFPKYSDRAVEGINRTVAAGMFVFFVNVLPMLLLPVLGPAGLAIGLLAAGVATVLSTEQKESLSDEHRRALEVQCQYCGALPSMWCITIKGASPGTLAKKLHAQRRH